MKNIFIMKNGDDNMQEEWGRERMLKVIRIIHESGKKGPTRARADRVSQEAYDTPLIYNKIFLIAKYFYVYQKTVLSSVNSVFLRLRIKLK